ncbi:MAG: AAA domain-containing protein [Chloroflexota bacterium]
MRSITSTIVPPVIDVRGAACEVASTGRTGHALLPGRPDMPVLSNQEILPDLGVLPVSDVATQSDNVTRQVLDAVVRAGEPLLIVSAPPGAGKTWLIETLTGVLVYCGLRVGVITPRVSQLDALLERLLANFPALAPIQVLQSAQRPMPPALAKHPGRVSVTTDAGSLHRGCGVVLSTAAKLFDTMGSGSLAGEFDVLICDEAWQIGYNNMAPMLGAARQTVLIGDPGQLPPLVRVPTARFDAAPVRVHRPAPETLLERYPGATHIRLPYSRRLTQGAVDLIQPSFYPALPFRAATEPYERRLALSGRSTRSAVDRAIDHLGEGASIVGLVLPRKASGWAGGVDEEMAGVEAAVVRRLLDRKARSAGNRIMEEDIGCINSRVNEGATLRKHLRARGISTERVRTDTAESWQGLERKAIVTRHPASGLTKLSAFDLETGRFCVMLSRSSVCTILTYREGLEDALAEHSHDCGARELGVEDSDFRSWSTHVALLTALENSGHVIRM